MSETTKTIFSHGAIYAIGVVIRNISSLIMLPIYTQHLTPKDYGTIEMLVLVIDFVAIFIGLQLEQGVFRQYGLTTSEQDKKRIINSAMLLMGGLNLLGVIAILLFSNPISLFVFEDTSYTGLISLFSFTLMFSALSEVPMTFLRAQGRPWLFVGASVLKLTLQLSSAMYFVVYRDMGVLGVIYGSLLAGTTFSIIMCTYTFWHTGLAISKKIMKELAIFSYPLMLAMMAMFCMTSMDKYMLRDFSGLESVGVYSLAYKFGFLITGIIGMPFLSVWEPLRYKIYKQPDARMQFSNVFRVYVLLLIIAWVGLSIFAEDVLRIMSAEEFWVASDVVPFLVMAYVFHCLTGFCNFGVMLSGNTFQMTYACVIGCLTMLALCFLLIPLHGAVGAGIAVMVAFIVRFLWVLVAGQRHYSFDIHWLEIFGYSFVVGTVYVLSLYAPAEVGMSVVFKLALVMAMFWVLWISPLLDESDREYVRHNTRRLWGIAFRKE